MVLIFFQLKRMLIDIVVGCALGIEFEVGLHILEAEQLVLPELGVEFEGYDVRAFDIDIKRITEVEDEFAADVHRTKEVGRFFEAIAGDLPQQGRIFLFCLLLGCQGRGQKEGKHSYQHTTPKWG